MSPLCVGLLSPYVLFALGLVPAAQGFPFFYRLSPGVPCRHSTASALAFRGIRHRLALVTPRQQRHTRPLDSIKMHSCSKTKLQLPAGVFVFPMHQIIHYRSVSNQTSLNAGSGSIACIRLPWISILYFFACGLWTVNTMRLPSFVARIENVSVPFAS